MFEPAKLNALRTEAYRRFGEHGLAGWEFQFDGAKRRLGYCNYRRKLISMSLKSSYANDEPVNTNTLLHEIAHALTAGHHHDKVWKAKCIEIGGDGERLGFEKPLNLDKSALLWDNGREIPERYAELWAMNKPKWQSRYNRALINLERWKAIHKKAERMERKYFLKVKYYQRKYELS